MPQLPDSQKNVNDALDLLVEAAHEERDILLEDGSFQKQLIEDPENLYWESRNSNRPLARFVKLLKNLEALGEDAENHMPLERAIILRQQIKKRVKAYRYSIDSKSSETIRDKNNAQSSLVDKLVRNKQERVYKVDEEIKKSIWDGIRGREEAEQD